MSELRVDGTGAGDEAQLVDRLRAGDEAAFEIVVRRYGTRLLATARRFFQEEHDARDAVQDALLSAFKAIRGFEAQCKLSTWLHRIVVNTSLMRIRSRRRRPETSIEDLRPQFDEGGHRILSDDSSDACVEKIVERRELLGHVRRCIDSLPETYRTVLLLRDVEELDTAEVATLLGISANAVKIRLHRAHQAVWTLLQQSHIEVPRSEPSSGRPGMAQNGPAAASPSE